MGLRLAAFTAGSIPNTSPMTTEKITLIRIAGTEIATGMPL